MVSHDPLWLRSWRRGNQKQWHVEVRTKSNNLKVVESYQGNDHTLHIILEKD